MRNSIFIEETDGSTARYERTPIAKTKPAPKKSGKKNATVQKISKCEQMAKELPPCKVIATRMTPEDAMAKIAEIERNGMVRKLEEKIRDLPSMYYL